MTERIHQGPIDEAAVLAWGFDEDLLFDQQDEDIVLGAHEEVFPTLARLAQDLTCPKADYSLSIMDFSLMFSVLRKNPGAADRIRRVLGLFEGVNRPQIEKFRQVNLLRLELLHGQAKVSRDRALTLGDAALNGIARNIDLSITEDADSWIVELSVPPLHRHKEWLTICKEDGQFTFRR
jgi:hypothetical protein